MKKLALAVIGLVVTLLAGCFGEDDHVCRARFDSNSAILAYSPCPGCTLNALGNVDDDNKGSFAEIRVNDSGSAPTGGATTIDIGDGHTFPAGSNAGAYIQFPAVANNQPATEGLSINTYLKGSRQETVYSDAASASGVKNAGGLNYYGGTTTLPFDEMDVQASISGTTTERSIAIHEICASM